METDKGSYLPEINIYNEDCMEGMKRYPDKYFELCICDPPYGIGDFEPSNNSKCAYKCEKKYNITWNNEIPQEEYFAELLRVSQDQIIWGANYYNTFTRGGAIVWDKDNTHPNMSACEIASNSLTRIVDKYRYTWHGMRQENMKNKEERIHPCQKPIALYKWLLTKYAKPNDKILDTHLGSGSIAIACYDLGFDLTGFEIDKDYFEAMIKRFEKHKQQLTLSL